MIRVVALIPVQPDKVEEFVTFTGTFIPPTRAEKGCVQYELHQSTANASEFAMIEEWESEDDLNAHLVSDHMKAAFARVPEFLSGPVDIRRYRLVA